MQWTMVPDYWVCVRCQEYPLTQCFERVPSPLLLGWLPRIKEDEARWPVDPLPVEGEEEVEEVAERKATSGG